MSRAMLLNQRDAGLIISAVGEVAAAIQSERPGQLLSLSAGLEKCSGAMTLLDQSHVGDLP